MKRLAILLTLVFPFGVHGQVEPPLASRSIIKYSPQHVGVNTFLTSVERFNHDLSQSIEVTVGARYHGQWLESEDQFERGGELGLHYRRYLRGMSTITRDRKRSFAQGIYWGPFAHAGVVRVRDLTGSLTTWATGVNPPRIESIFEHNYYEEYFLATGFTIGVQRVFWNVLAVDVFAGGGMRWSNVKFLAPQERSLNTDIITPGFQGIFPRIGLKIGVTL